MTPCIILIDPHGTLIEEIEHLKILEGSDKVIIVDPRDTSAPPALNMFAPRRLSNYSEDVRREIENNTISLYQYMFGSIASGLTAKQASAFGFIVRLLFSIPGATIHTLLELTEDTSKTLADSPFNQYIQRLDSPTARRWFEGHFYNKSEYGETRQQITHRLYALLQYKEFEQMFSAQERKLDMFDCMQTGKLVLVHAARSRLGKEGSQLFGRYMIALAFAAAFERMGIPQSQWHPAYLIVDEAGDFFDDQIETMLDTVRKFKLGLTFAHQRIEGQVSDAMRSALSANTSIKYAGGLAARDASFMAKDMQCEPEFIMGQQKNTEETHFACFVRGFTPHPMSVPVPLGLLAKEPKMSAEAHALMRQKNRERLSAPPASKPATPPSDMSSSNVVATELPKARLDPDTPEAGSTW